VEDTQLGENHVEKDGALTTQGEISAYYVRDGGPHLVPNSFKNRKTKGKQGGRKRICVESKKKKPNKVNAIAPFTRGSLCRVKSPGKVHKPISVADKS